MSISAEEKVCYLREAAIVLAREGFHTDRTHTGGLRVLLDGAPLCEVTESGGITYRNEDIDEPERPDAKDKVSEAQDKVDGAAIDLFSAYNNYRWAVDHGILN